MGAVEPVRQMGGRLVRRLAVEGHHRGRDAGTPLQLRAPALLLDPRHLDEVAAARTHSFKPMLHDDDTFRKSWKEEQREFYASVDFDQANKVRRWRDLNVPRRFARNLREEIFRCRSFHMIFTIYPQVLHTRLQA